MFDKPKIILDLDEYEELIKHSKAKHFQEQLDVCKKIIAAIADYGYSGAIKRLSSEGIEWSVVYEGEKSFLLPAKDRVKIKIKKKNETI